MSVECNCFRMRDVTTTKRSFIIVVILYRCQTNAISHQVQIIVHIFIKTKKQKLSVFKISPFLNRAFQISNCCQCCHSFQQFEIWTNHSNKEINFVVLMCLRESQTHENNKIIFFIFRIAAFVWIHWQNYDD